MTERSRLRVALVGGPMYDHLYEIFHDHDVEIVIHADHPTLNARAAQMLAHGERIDLLSTHSKYAPSQSTWLHDLDDLVDRRLLDPLAPGAIELCRYNGRLLCAPRLIDVRILWVRKDRVSGTLHSWADLLDSDIRFGFPGRDSGLFGTFYELVTGAGGRIFSDDGSPAMASSDAVGAIDTLCSLHQRVPGGVATWHYDAVDEALLDGRIDAAAAWPGAWGRIRTSPLSDELAPRPYLSGAQRRVSYAGCHAWAIPATCGDREGAVALLGQLLSADAQARDARGGSVCAHEAAFASVVPDGPLDTERLAQITEAIRTTMITYPPRVRFPEVENAGWRIIQSALLHERTAHEAATALQSAALRLLAE